MKNMKGNKDDSESVDFLCVKQKFHKFYVCHSCATECYFCVTNTWNSLPKPDRCPYSTEDDAIVPEWIEMENEKKS